MITRAPAPGAWRAAPKNPDKVPQSVLNRLAAKVFDAVERARGLGEIVRSPSAAQLWAGLYPELEEERISGLAGKLISRSSAHVLRLSLIYALLDGSPVVDDEHLLAAVELWRYSEASVECMFGERLGDPIADTILDALRETGTLTKTDIINLGSRKWPAAKIAEALQALIERRLAQSESEATGGRRGERWSLVTA